MLTDFTPVMGAELFENKGMLMAVITASGIVVVFAILILLIFIFYAYGAIFSAVTSSKEKKKAAKAALEKLEKNETEKSGAQVEAAQTGAADLPADGEIPGEIIAVIAAAVAALGDGKTYRVKKVTRAPVAGRTPWATAGLLENVRPF